MMKIFIVISKRIWGDDYGTAVALGDYSVKTKKVGNTQHWKNIHYPAFKTKESALEYIDKMKKESSGWNNDVKVIEIPLFD